MTSVGATAIPTQRQINHATTLSQTYQNDATIVELQTVTYSIGTGAGGLPALFRSEFGNNLELIDGIDDMQILYGVDSDNDGLPNQYFPSNAVPNFNNVVSVRIMLLASSINAFVTDTPQTYTFNGAAITAADNRLRQVFSTTVELRNR